MLVPKCALGAPCPGDCPAALGAFCVHAAEPSRVWGPDHSRAPDVAFLWCPAACMWLARGWGLSHWQEAEARGQSPLGAWVWGDPQCDLQAMPWVPGHPEEKAAPAGDSGHVGLLGAAPAVAPGAGGGRHGARLQTWVSPPPTPGQCPPNFQGLWLFLVAAAENPFHSDLEKPLPQVLSFLGVWGWEGRGLGLGGSGSGDPPADSLPPPLGAGCVPLGLPGAPCPSPSHSVCTSPSSPPATGPESAARTGERLLPPRVSSRALAGGQFPPERETEATSEPVAETDACLNVVVMVPGTTPRSPAPHPRF